MPVEFISIGQFLREITLDENFFISINLLFLNEVPELKRLLLISKEIFTSYIFQFISEKYKIEWRWSPSELWKFKGAWFGAFGSKMRFNFFIIYPKSMTIQNLDLRLKYNNFWKKFLQIMRWNTKKVSKELEVWLRLRSEKAGRFAKLLDFARSHSIVTRGSVSLFCATTPHPPRFYKSQRYIKLKYFKYKKSQVLRTMICPCCDFKSHHKNAHNLCYESSLTWRCEFLGNMRNSQLKRFC